MEYTEKIIRVEYSIAFEYCPYGEHDFLFEDMTEKEIKEKCLRLAFIDLATADLDSFYEKIMEIEVEI